MVEETGVLGENKDCIGCKIKPGAFHRAIKKRTKRYKNDKSIETKSNNATKFIQEIDRKFIPTNVRTIYATVNRFIIFISFFFRFVI